MIAQQIIAYVALAIVMFTLVFLLNYKEKEHDKQTKQLYDLIGELNQQWHKERQQLLDRIQAPSFAEYTNKVIREKKADKEQEEKPVEFIS